MAEFEWKIAKANPACCLCQTPFAPGQQCFSALLQEESILARRDYCVACFQDKRPANVFYFWRTTQPDPEADEKNARRKPVMDIEHVLDFFRRLESARPAEPANPGVAQRAVFRYILALMLARKKVLAFEGRKRDSAGAEVSIFRERRGNEAHEVYEPALSPEEIAAVATELGALLGLAPLAVPAGKAHTAGSAADGNTSVTGGTAV